MRVQRTEKRQVEKDRWKETGGQAEFVHLLLPCKQCKGLLVLQGDPQSLCMALLLSLEMHALGAFADHKKVQNYDASAGYPPYFRMVLLLSLKLGFHAPLNLFLS